jgi:hypothetical protein
MFPSKIVVSKCFGVLRSACTNLSDLLLLLPNRLISSLVNEKKAVSVAEKKAEKQSRNNINRICGR